MAWAPAPSPAVADLAEELGDPEVTPAGLMACLGEIVYQYRYETPAGFCDQDLDFASLLVEEYRAIG